MRNARLKAAVLASVAAREDFSALAALNRASPDQHRDLLRWLDQSGLALYFLDHLQRHNVAGSLPAGFRSALERRLAANRKRTTDMLEEFRRLVSSFTNFGIHFCALKGPSLIPDFCPALHLRHQTDVDFLVSPETVSYARRALASQGYEQSEIQRTGQLTFCTPRTHVPTAGDDIYALPRHREVDLLHSLRLDFHNVSLAVPSGQLERAHVKADGDFPFPALASADLFSLQVLHAFSHLLGSWVRMSWLLEIRHFLELHHHDDALWQSIIQRHAPPGHGPIPDTAAMANSRGAFGLILWLTNAIFPIAQGIPRPLDGWCIEPLPLAVRAWVHRFAGPFAHADLNGAKVTLFVHREFVDTATKHGRRAWRRYAFGRLFPFGRRPSMGGVSSSATGVKIRSTIFQWLHSMRRALFHCRELVSLPMDAIRWKRAVRAFQGQAAHAAQTSGPFPAKPGTASRDALPNLASRF